MKKPSVLNYTPLSKKFLKENKIRQDKYPNLLRCNYNGRPTKYDPLMVEEVYKYIAEIQSSKTKILIGVEAFAVRIGVDDDTVVRWAKKRLKDENGVETNKRARPEFYAAIKTLKALQKAQLMQDSFYGGKEVNGRVGMFLLAANHSMDEFNRQSSLKEKESVVPILKGDSNVSGNNSNT